MRTRRSYDKEFKKMAVELMESGQTSAQVADDLGIKPDLIRRWRREFIVNKEGSFSGNGNPNLTAEQKEVTELKKELREVKLERDILKKAVSIFSKSDGKFSSL